MVSCLQNVLLSYNLLHRHTIKYGSLRYIIDNMSCVRFLLGKVVPMQLGEVELSLQALERFLKVHITAVDHQGAFLSPAGLLTFHPSRKSHRKNKVCDLGFCDKCVQHCRFEMNLRGEAATGYFVETCWKGITEIVFPLHIKGSHVGMLYLGSWRREDVVLPSGLGSAFSREFRKLPFFDSEAASAIASVMQFYVKGLVRELEEQCVLRFPEDSRAGEIRKYLQTHAVEDITMTDLCCHLSLSRSRASFLLQQYFAKGFLEIVNEIRIQAAKRILLSTDEPIGFVAGQAGFHDEFHFIRVFKKICGCPPGRYRKLLRAR